MKSYSVKEMFFTIQGEGANAGRPAVFIRFAGCNLWSGREQDRQDAKGSCAMWCDTDFVGADFGVLDGATLAKRARLLWPDQRANHIAHPMCVLTGGEPTLQVDGLLVKELRSNGFEVAMESNGTRLPPLWLSWLTISPKHGTPIVVDRCDELKVVFPQQTNPLEFERQVEAKWKFIQPMHGHSGSTQLAVDFVRQNPAWRLSLQLHKMLGIP